MKKVAALFAIAAVLYCFAVFMFPVTRNFELQFAVRSVTIGGAIYGYRVYIPPNRNRKEQLPIVLFLHGAGERGSDNVAQTKVGIGPALASGAYPAIVVMPQCPEGRLWTDQAVREFTMVALESAIQEFNGDSERIYLTGISMGGYGAWSFAYHYPKKFAALAPIAGGVKRLETNYKNLVLDAVSDAEDIYGDITKKIGTMPVWAFEGRLDTTVPWADQHQMVEALRVSGNNARETIYEDLDHHIWDRAYVDPELARWFFAGASRNKVN